MLNERSLIQTATFYVPFVRNSRKGKATMLKKKKKADEYLPGAEDKGRRLTEKKHEKILLR